MKNKSSSKKPSVAVKDLVAKKNPKGGGEYTQKIQQLYVDYLKKPRGKDK